MSKLTRSGQTILEVVIAATLISMGVIAALSLTNQSQKSSNYAKTLDSATAYNNQLADYLRSQKSTLGFATLAEKVSQDSGGGSATYCFSTLPSSSAEFLGLNPSTCDSSSVIPGTIFLREASLSANQIAQGIIPIIITTTWTDNTLRSAVLNQELTQW